MMTVIAVFVGSLSAGPDSNETDTAKVKLPTTPAELLKFLPGTTWRLHSGKGEYYGEGALHFKEKGFVDHLYKDGVIHKKRWGVTSDMKVVWGGKFMHICRFTDDFKVFVDNLNETTGRRTTHPDLSGSKVKSEQ